MSGGHIRQRGSSWEIKYDIGADPITGKRRIRYETLRGSKRDAQRRLRELLGSVDKGAHVDKSELTVAELVSKRIALWQASGRIGAKSAERAEELLRYQLTRISGIPIQKLRTDDVEQWHAALLTAGTAPRTIRDAHGLLARCLDEAMKHGLISRNVCRLQRPPRVPRSEIQIVASEEIGPMLTKLEGDVFHTPVLVALYCGLRRSEQLALLWSDIDIDRKTLRVERALEDTRAGGVVVKKPKTQAGIRTVSLPEIVVAALKAHRRQQLELRLQLGAGRMPDDQPVFPDLPSFGYQRPRVFTVKWCRAVKRLGLPRIGWHALRHTHASMLIAAGIDVATIAKRLGHASPTVTLSTYIHSFKRDDRAAADAIDRLAR